MQGQRPRRSKIEVFKAALGRRTRHRRRPDAKGKPPQDRRSRRPKAEVSNKAALVSMARHRRRPDAKGKPPQDRRSRRSKIEVRLQDLAEPKAKRVARRKPSRSTDARPKAAQDIYGRSPRERSERRGRSGRHQESAANAEADQADSKAKGRAGQRPKSLIRLL